MEFSISNDTLLKVSGVCAAAQGLVALAAPRSYHDAYHLPVRLQEHWRGLGWRPATARAAASLRPRLGRTLRAWGRWCRRGRGSKCPEQCWLAAAAQLPPPPLASRRRQCSRLR